jgi:hypothetical protein
MDESGENLLEPKYIAFARLETCTFSVVEPFFGCK